MFQNVPNWGGLCVDEKGVYTETLEAMAAHCGRSEHLIHLEVRPDDADLTWRPRHRFNLTGDRTIPFSTYAKFVVDTATSLGQGGDKGFFKPHLLRTLRDHECVFVHCERGFRRRTLAPLDARGAIPGWYRRW